MQNLIRVLLVLLLIAFLSAPGTVLRAAQNGAEVWFQNVLPALLPFFILNRLLSVYGVLALAAKACHRAMCHLWHVPGNGAFILLAGYTSGAPISSSLVAEAYRQGALNRGEAVRLLAASANVSPLFILSAVAAGFLTNPGLGPPLLLAVYGSNLLLSLLWARRSPRSQAAPPTPSFAPPTPPFGRALAESTAAALRSVACIGGLMVVYFVWLAVCERLGLVNLVTSAAQCCDLHGEAVRAGFYGLFEVTAGCHATATANFAGLRPQLALLAAILSFGGLSVHSQVAAEIADTDLTMAAFTKYKAIQAVLAYGLMSMFPAVSGVSTIAPAETGDISLALLFSLLLLLPYVPVLILLLKAQVDKGRLIRRKCWNRWRKNRRRQTAFSRTDGSRPDSF